ncbi:hypothetical protein B0H16DRAFT_1009803 [Mycena metata]|uniref:F-box domain-containing protein n=1 Tax=Mycena metata TaxID=1033252 RepID=A0AAD7N3X3_9AGAR|nr:hypothetical protein B0H16DRAFT_1009803 [Mycena metata]
MPSPFASRLSTNYCPSDEEIIDIRTLLIEPKSRLKRIDDKIADLQKAIDSLTEERASVKSFVDAHDALLSPLRRLPLDIIQEIFVACLPTHRNCVMSTVEAPLLLGRICSSWRAIVLSTPRLWARLHIVEPGYNGIVPSSVILEEKVAQRVDTVKTWLTRSGVCPISISLEGVRQSPMPTGVLAPSSTRLFLQALIPFSSRWQDITMSFVFSPEALETLFGLAETDVPMLSKLHIVRQQHHGQEAPPSVLWRSFAFLHTPTLSDLAFTGYQANLLELPIQWTNITTLLLTGRMEGLRPDLMLGILSKCPQIQTCHFGLPYAEHGTISLDINDSVTELVHLRSLQITGWLDGITGILRPLLVPALREFALNGRMSALDPTLPSHLTAFFARSQGLQGLVINTYLFDNISLLELLRNLPATIQRLHVSNVKAILDADAFAMLIPPESLSGDPQVAVSCPELQDLTISGGQCPSDEALVRFVTARMMIEPPRARLTRLEIRLDRAMEFDIRPRIQPFLDTGLKLYTTYHPPPTAQMFSAWHGLVDDYPR